MVPVWHRAHLKWNDSLTTTRIQLVRRCTRSGEYSWKGVRLIFRTWLSSETFNFLFPSPCSCIVFSNTGRLANLGNLALILICGNITQPISNQIFPLEPHILLLERWFSSKVPETPFSCRNVAVFGPILKPKIKEIGMPEIGRRFCFASRSETNSLIELKFRLEVPNTSIKRKQKSYSRLNNNLVHNNGSFDSESCVPKLGRFHTFWSPFHKVKWRGNGTLLWEHLKLKYLKENQNKIKILLLSIFILPMMSVIVKFQPRKSHSCHLIANRKLLLKSSFHLLTWKCLFLGPDIIMKTRSI